MLSTINSPTDKMYPTVVRENKSVSSNQWYLLSDGRKESLSNIFLQFHKIRYKKADSQAIYVAVSTSHLFLQKGTWLQLISER